MENISTFRSLKKKKKQKEKKEKNKNKAMDNGDDHELL